ncbi:uncharacterized protein LOC129614200 [Condylostylus longicornis]|uniref:uncharacterized protein LOC129614200 n=1 Tax=Condylostylus longicornis TaxID=2530218 RepID=UPI00244E4CA8|nr:uncharacterized protein LOC129614200 [Condylostylus longicornis]
MSITAEGSIDPYIGGINYKIIASWAVTKDKGNLKLGAFIKGNSKDYGSFSTGVFGGLYYGGHGILLTRDFNNDFISTTTGSIQIKLLDDGANKLNATVHKTVTSLNKTNLQMEDYSASLGLNDLLHGPGFEIKAVKTLTGDYKYHFRGKLTLFSDNVNDVSFLGEVVDLFGKSRLLGGISASRKVLDM